MDDYSLESRQVAWGRLKSHCIVPRNFFYKIQNRILTQYLFFDTATFFGYFEQDKTSMLSLNCCKRKLEDYTANLMGPPVLQGNSK